jgi:hypothetical protein
MKKKQDMPFVFVGSFILMNLALVVWRVFQPTSLIFDQAVIVILLSCIIFLFVLKQKFAKADEVIELKKKINVLKFIASSMLFMIWILLVPGTVERSRSLAIFKWVQFDSQVHTISDIENALQKSYNGFDLPGFQLRLHEHTVRGLMSIDSKNNVRLTLFGEVIFTSAEITAFVYRLNGWYDIPLGPESDV